MFAVLMSADARVPSNENKIYAEQDFREAVKLIFKKERQNEKSYFAKFKKSYLDDPKRIEFGNYWSEEATGFNYFIIDRKKMKYEYNYMVGNWGIKIHGDIRQQGEKLRCDSPRIIRFMHINRG